MKIGKDKYGLLRSIGFAYLEILTKLDKHEVAKIIEELKKSISTEETQKAITKLSKRISNMKEESKQGEVTQKILIATFIELEKVFQIEESTFIDALSHFCRRNYSVCEAIQSVYNGNWGNRVTN